LAPENTRAIHSPRSNDRFPHEADFSVSIDHVAFEGLLPAEWHEQIQVPRPDGAEVCTGSVNAWSMLNNCDKVDRVPDRGPGEADRSHMLKVPPEIEKLLQWSNIPLEREAKEKVGALL
jgi:hypothetical protein